MFEANIQVISDLLISKDGKLGTVRGKEDKQKVKLYYQMYDFLIPYKNPEFPHYH
jgi:hypothetical protein